MAKNKTAAVKVNETQNVGSNVNTNTNTNTAGAVETKVVYDVNELLKTNGNNKSAVIRYLAAQGLKTTEIVKVFHQGQQTMLYQFARNVLNQKLKGQAQTASTVTTVAGDTDGGQ
jgi:hypothetical protein